MATAWRLARALDVYRAELNTRWSARDRRSDGGIGDADHATRSSDHNPWVKVGNVGIVRAWDTDKDLLGAATDALPPEVNVEANWLAEHLRALGRGGDPRLIGGGYVIWNRRIASEVANWAWRPYSGVNAHKHHVHVSVSRNAAGFDSAAPWGITVQEDDDMDQQQLNTLLNAAGIIERALGTKLPSKVEGSTFEGYLPLFVQNTNADAYKLRIELAELRAIVQAQASAIGVLATAKGADAGAIQAAAEAGARDALDSFTLKIEKES